MSVTYRLQPLSIQFEPTMNNEGNGLDFRSQSDICQNLNSFANFENNINPLYRDEREIKIPTKASGKMVRARIYQSNAFKREYGHEDETRGIEPSFARSQTRTRGKSTSCKYEDEVLD